ncbi:NAD(P)H-dependent oxidoreductase [Litorilinea aerophila]|uniref:NADPH-dependent FMN reductase n=1 Tax=Litorilinea aerophila TaxID=1204385 RepID=UPI001B85C87E|nr:NADPH-dependent FMN reductase [Litorilinea aerophila]MCC9076474.1 NAD(P)H-dependent oxidoreductase [Litorilinea aerophila]
MEPIQVLAFAGSLRQHSYNRALLRAAVELAPAQMQIHIFDLSPLPLYNADVEAAGTPPAVRTFQRQIAAADALLIATPEYNYSVSGVLKNALDWASRRLSAEELPALNGKPAAILGAGGRFGTVRAQAHLRYILLHNDVKVLNKPELMIPRASQFFDEEGRLVDEELRERLRDLLDALYEWTLLFRHR